MRGLYFYINLYYIYLIVNFLFVYIVLLVYNSRSIIYFFVANVTNGITSIVLNFTGGLKFMSAPLAV